MRHKEYIETCEICHKTYVASRKGSTVCSNVCRAQKSRNKKSLFLKTVLSKMANCEDCGKHEKIERLTHIGFKKDTSLLCYDCWNKRHSG